MAIYQILELQFDTESRTLSGVDGKSIVLAKTLYRLLMLFVENPKTPLTKYWLQRQVDPGFQMDAGTLTRNVSRLRQALGDNSRHPRFLKNHHGHGYEFVAPVVKLKDQAPLLAVLPFKMIQGGSQGDCNDGHIRAIGLSELLEKSPEIRVLSWSAAIDLSSKPDPRSDARALGVDYLLWGRFIEQGQSNFWAVELLDTKDNFTAVWRKSFAVTRAQIGDVEGEISRQVLSTLTKSTHPAGKISTGKERVGVTVRDLYARGRYFLNRRDRASILKARECFENALKEDSEYAPAYSGLADAFFMLSAFGSEMEPPNTYMPLARKNASKALEIDANLAEAHASLGNVQAVFDWTFDEAERSYRRAIDLNPNYESTYQWLANILTIKKKFDAAIETNQVASRVNPLSLATKANLGWILYFARRYQEAADNSLQVIEMDSNFFRGHVFYALASRQLGDTATALEELNVACRLSPNNPPVLGELGYTYALTGNQEEARSVLSAFDLMTGRYVSPYCVAVVHVGLGDHGSALRCLEKAYEERSGWLIWIDIDPVFDELRGEPAFIEIVQRVGPAEWRPRAML